MLGGAFQHYRYDPEDQNSLSGDQILSLLEGPAGVMWIGTEEGLNRLNMESGAVTRFSVWDGLPGRMVTCILPESKSGSGLDALWLGTTHGITRFNLENERFQVYTVDDGLQSREFISGACFLTTRGEMLFGSVQGWNAFYPSEVLGFNRPLQVLVTAVKSGGQVVYRGLMGGERLQFTHRDDLLTFEFAALDYNDPHRSRYLYQLEGADPDWVDSGERRSAGYSDLKGGSYTFRVRAASGDNDLSESEVSIAVTITPPIWETPWFRIGVLLLLLGLIAGGYRLRVGQIQRRNLELERRVAELSQQVQEAAVREERSRLARGLHDSVTQSLYSLTLLVEAGRRTLERGDTVQSLKNLNRVAEIAQQALQEMRLMVFQLRQPELEKLGLAGALEHRLEAVERRAGVNARLVVALTQPLQPGIEEDLYWLAQEALNNALKHSGAEFVIIRLFEQGDCLMLEVRDSSRGFDPEALQGSGGFGQAGMRERAEKLCGQLEVESKLRQGTCVRFTKQGPFSTS